MEMSADATKPKKGKSLIVKIRNLVLIILFAFAIGFALGYYYGYDFGFEKAAKILVK